jgi:hypothetical protein
LDLIQIFSNYLPRNPDGIENLQSLSETKLIVDEEAFEVSGLAFLTFDFACKGEF